MGMHAVKSSKAISEAPDTEVPVLEKMLKAVKHDMVLIRPHVKKGIKDEAGKTLIHMPDAHQKEPTRGIVIAVGPGRLNENGVRNKPSAEIGEDVIFPMHARKHHLIIDGEKYLAIKDEDLLLSVTGDHDIKVGTTDV